MGEKIWTKNYITALIVMFGIYMVSSILLAVMSIYAKDLTGVDTYAGLMVSTFTLGALAVRFLAGGLIDRFSSKKVILTGIGILILGSIGLLISKGIAGLLIARTLQGVGFGLSATAASTLIATICPPSRLMEGIGYMSVIQSLTAVLGPMIGFLIVGNRYDNFSALFWTAAGMALLTLLIMIFEKDAGHHTENKTSGGDDSNRIRWAMIVLPLTVLFMNALSQSAITSFLALFAISLKLVGVGSFFSINAIGVITSRFIMNRLVKRFGEFTMILINTIIFTICIFMLTQVTALHQMLILAFPAGFAMGSVAPIVNTYLIQTMPGNKKGLSNALYFSALDIGFGIGSVIWGMVAMNFGYVQVFFISSVLQGIGILLTLVQMKLFAVKKKMVAEANNQ